MYSSLDNYGTPTKTEVFMIIVILYHECVLTIYIWFIVTKIMRGGRKVWRVYTRRQYMRETLVGG
jgi:hypothetical protein